MQHMRAGTSGFVYLGGLRASLGADGAQVEAQMAMGYAPWDVPTDSR
jgi:hypothetical protein